MGGVEALAGMYGNLQLIYYETNRDKEREREIERDRGREREVERE